MTEPRDSAVRRLGLLAASTLAQDPESSVLLHLHRAGDELPKTQGEDGGRRRQANAGNRRFGPGAGPGEDLP